MRHKLMGGNIILKRWVVPHIFDCQPDRKRVSTVPDRSLPVKRQRKQLISEVIAETDNKQQNTPIITHEDEPCASTSYQLPLMGESDLQYTTDDLLVSTVVNLLEEPQKTRNVGVQAKPTYRSKQILCNMGKSIKNTSTSPMKYFYLKDASSSPIKIACNVRKISSQLASSSSDIEVDSISTSSFIGSTDSDYIGDDCPQDIKEEQLKALHVTQSLIEKNPKKYTGIPDHWFQHIINLLNTKSKLSKDNLMLTLMKIKLNHQFFLLGDMFGMSTSNASKIFKKSLIKIVPHLKTLIFWPSKDKMQYYLPIPFRARYSNIQSIIDCLEIQIQKPTDPVKQALTWSEYKKCNTLKYLISSTPDGFINFISRGYGGRISDSLLVEESGFLDLLPDGCSVMADRGFKDIGKQLHDKNCQLVRPPSVSSSVKPTKSEVLETKRIASLRIHIERVIRRLREFEYLKPHAVIDHNFIGHTDQVIEIACALINLQGPIIKQT